MHRDSCCDLSCLTVILGFLVSSSRALENITECGLRCSQGLHCNSKMYYYDQYRDCRKHRSSLPSKVVEDLKMFTVLKCERKRQCSIRLRVKATLMLNEHIRGVEICTLSMHTFRSQCVVVRIKKNSSKKLAGQLVEIEHSCFNAEIADLISVTFKTIPYYCDIYLNQEYEVEDCNNEDIGRNIPICIAGKLNYLINKTEKTISIQVSDFLEDQAYTVRLCHKWFTCEDVGTIALIKAQDSIKEVTLAYSRIVPCLCMEGWSAIPDSRRIQLCPFKNYTAELWNGITYDPIAQELAWKPICPVQVVVNFCWMTGEDDHCIDLPNSIHKVQKEVKYSRVDPHPTLCVKFTTDERSWVRCPFAHGYLPVWNMSTRIQVDQLQLTFSTQDKSEFKMALCNRTAPWSCEPVKETHVRANCSGTNSIAVNLPQEVCDTNICIQGWRTDLEYSVRIQICDIICKLNSTEVSLQYGLIILFIGISLFLVIAVGYISFTAHQPYRKLFLQSKQSP
ncbi:putative interleukin-17 receptor E-like isoform X1 [Callorhinchus milii]|uniref:Putative interleukin-17 receptor E-like protein n=1 Tax=Callorhinchus milii TaxID=7868 RepID=V9KTE9_CALMI|nr:putative interleukin-17 receptor E-like isoform X1 [Callorhinchus milii]|eukprot:gi/632947670/ref/XP_007889166.1/ PREDICTED: putative interleukin-17 receptor E-like isoform X2 [Callorhinchus milii]